MGRAGVVLPIAVGGAALSVVGEAWHAYSHLRLDTHSAPLAGLLSLVGYVVAVVAVSLWARTRRRRGARRPDERRAA
jgi:membrane protein implicated in regulation of membrane protease activity